MMVGFLCGMGPMIYMKKHFQTGIFFEQGYQWGLVKYPKAYLGVS